MKRVSVAQQLHVSLRSLWAMPWVNWWGATRAATETLELWKCLLWRDELCFTIWQPDKWICVWQMPENIYLAEYIVPTEIFGRRGIMGWGCFFKISFFKTISFKKWHLHSNHLSNVWHEPFIEWLFASPFSVKIVTFSGNTMWYSHGHCITQYDLIQDIPSS